MPGRSIAEQREIHQILLAWGGIYIFETMITGPLLADKACEFTFVPATHPLCYIAVVTLHKFYFAYFWFSSASGGGENFA